MRVVEAVTENEVCGHCRAPWTSDSEIGNGCCPEDREDVAADEPGLFARIDDHPGRIWPARSMFE